MGFSIAPDEEKKKWGGFNLLSLILVILIIGFLAAISTPKFSAARGRANTRACYANQKTLNGAVEMYQESIHMPVTDLAAAMPALVKAGFVIGAMDDPGQGSNTSDHYRIEPKLGVVCTVHGAIPR